MLLDNAKGGSEDRTVAGWLSKYIEAGDMDVVTGYFTIGALSWLSERMRGKVESCRIIWGGVAGGVGEKFDLLTQDIGINGAFRLRKAAERAINFLESNDVEVKVAEPDFCSVKLFLLNAADEERKFFVTGSSNLTEAGLGLNSAGGAELNAASVGGGSEFSAYAAWFNALWNKTQKVKDAKQEFLDEIVKVFREYAPNDVYMKIVSELLPEEVSREKIEQRLGNSEIYTALFDFQKKAVVSLIKMLEKKNGAILADAVGLGKTSTALAVIKYYRMQNREVVVVTPARNRRNWEQHTWHNGALPDGANFDYEMIFHDELNEDRVSDRLVYLTDERPKLFVIDESHCLLDDKGGRYQFLLEKLLRKNSDVKVLMLSATPINNSFWGLRNLFKLIGGFENADALFRRAQEKLNEWTKEECPAISTLIGALRGIDGGNFLNLTDSVILARTRAMVTTPEISFPTLEPPVNIFENLNCVDGAKTIPDIMDMLPVRFSAYMPTVYADLTNKQGALNDCKRSLFTVKMIHVLLMKRLESSWVSFKISLEKIAAHHRSVLQMLERSGEIECPNAAELLQDEDSPEFDDFFIGKEQKISIRDIRDVNKYEKDIFEDVGKLDKLLTELEKFSLAKDIKIKRLIKTVEKHLQDDGGSRKALVFTKYGDTAEYLFSCLRVYFGNRATVECVTGDTKNIEDILKRFSPISKKASADDSKTPIDILIATDVLGEGQNLQDCDCVVNYDIHWNPARVVQRVGRINRVGGRNKTVRCVNFWPSQSIDEYMDLRKHIDERLATMTVAGSAVSKDIADDGGETGANDIEREQIKKSLTIIQNNMADIEQETLGLNHLSLEVFRQDLTGESMERYKSLPHGIFSGFKAERQGLIALLRHRKNNDKKIAFINEQGEEILSSRQEILQFLHDNKDKPRHVPAPIEDCDDAETDKLSLTLRTWLETRIGAEIKTVMDGLFAGGQAALDLSAKQKAHLEETLAPDNWDLICWEVVGGDF